MKYLLLVFILTGCNCYKPGTKFVFSDNKEVECSSVVRNNCGVSLWNCKDGLEYHCVQNVKVIEPK